ncbi:cytochrome P450 [Chengkuizengella axinellae]|uniref:Cytochrome P450 n=1 Tax=Chengkuizengella axinellae TaxID=3064388 RepID=A0ABT9J140_9BACL|nr:cytochrome P450 [Chengkuizengella sp. 2205SS18-9]MDP5275132.1 cytochrome P450 [Chengkuizengella sp. 2205SS18-9]
MEVRTGIPVASPEETKLFHNDLNGILTLQQKYTKDRVVYIPEPNQGLYILFNADDIGEVLVKKQTSFEKGSTANLLKSLLGDGLVTSKNHKHRKDRKLMQPMFQFQSIENFAPHMVKQTYSLTENWEDGQIRDISSEMNEITLNIITDTMFGTKVDKELLSGLRSSLKNFGRFIMKSSKNKQVDEKEIFNFRQNIQLINQIVMSIIEKRKLENIDDYHDLLSLLLKAKDEDNNQLTNEEIKDQVMTIFVAGHGTTANMLSWIWYLISQHPEVEQKFYQEIDSVLAGEPPTIHDLKNLQYTDLIIQEALRFYPVVYQMRRLVIEEVQIGEHTFQKGDEVLLSQYAIHRNPLYYDHANEFIPERFAQENIKNNPKFSYFPFGGGARVCIGNHFALQEAALILATIAQQYQLQLSNPDNVGIEPLITLNPKNGLEMTLKKR